MLLVLITKNEIRCRLMDHYLSKKKHAVLEEDITGSDIVIRQVRGTGFTIVVSTAVFLYLV